MSPRRLPAEDIQRILALVPFLVNNPGISKEVAATRFGLSIEELEDDLDLILMIGVPPFGGGDYIDVDTTDDKITLWMADSFSRPMQLSAAEGLALLTAGRALLAVPGAEADGPLAMALRKLENTLGSPELIVEIPAPRHLEEVREATDSSVRIRIVYAAAGTEGTTTRVIDPVGVFCAMGEWYLEAYCHHARADRLFRVDRIVAIEQTYEHFAPPESEKLSLTIFHPKPTDPRVTIDIDPSASWVAERFPVESVLKRDSGDLRVTMAVTRPAFLSNLLLRLGPSALVVSPPEFRDIAVEPAQRMLDRYRGKHS